jgi:pimeloyl-ACP methyl ester carboxylesterase
LVHGTNLDSASSFGHLIERFTDRRTVITPDLAGCGDTTMPAGELALALLVDQVIGAMQATTQEPVDIVGWSLGAAVAAAAAARHPGLVRRLVLIAGWTHSEDVRLRLGLETWRRLVDVDPELFTACGVLLGFSPAFVSGLGADGLAQVRKGMPAPGFRQQVELDLQIDLRAELPRISAPTLVVGCAQDNLVPVRHARDLHRAIPGSSYAELDCGHVVVFEKPDELSDLIRDFLLEPGDPRR